jgi:hypothetical protein
MRRDRLRRGLSIIVVAALGVGCSQAQTPAGSPSGPTEPTGSTVEVSGIVVSTQSGAPVPFAYLNVEGGGAATHFETDVSGRFTLTAPLRSQPVRIQVGMAASRVASGQSSPFINRAVNISVGWPRTGLRLDIIEDVAPFSSTFYRQFARDARDTPPGNRTLRPWTRAPSFYVQSTHVETGLPIPPEIIAEFETLFRNSVPELTGGRFGVAAFESGPAARPPVAGWVNVLFQSVLPTPGAGGQATVGGSQGTIWIRFDPEQPLLSPESGQACSWATGAAEHEVVHTMGFYHVDAPPGVEKPFQSPDFCSGRNRPEVIRHHAAIMYARPFGNAHEDNDPSSFLSSTAGPAPAHVVACTLR